MTYTCTVAWCAFDGRSLAALLRHVRHVHPWLAARERRSSRVEKLRDWRHNRRPSRPWAAERPAPKPEEA